MRAAPSKSVPRCRRANRDAIHEPHHEVELIGTSLAIEGISSVRLGDDSHHGPIAWRHGLDGGLMHAGLEQVDRPSGNGSLWKR
jgi:hypothetical protein